MCYYMFPYSIITLVLCGIRCRHLILKKDNKMLLIVPLMNVWFWCPCGPDICLFCETDTERAVGLLRRYQANLTSPEEQSLKNSVGKVSAILGSRLFQALLGKKELLWRGEFSWCGLSKLLLCLHLLICVLHLPHPLVIGLNNPNSKSVGTLCEI